MRVLLTGGLGYIGSHLYERLSKDNEIVILDNFSNNFSKNACIDNVIKGDIRDRNLVFNLMKDKDTIIHMAAQISMSRSIEDPINDADNNINGTLNLLDVARKTEIEHFIYISSAAVFGVPNYLPIDEKHPTNPISPYGLSKLTGERYSKLYNDLYELPVTCLRFFNVFGPRQAKNDYSGVITKFIEKISMDESPIIFGDGNQTRDFIYIDDIVESICLAINRKKSMGEIINIGTGNPTKIKDLANFIIKIYNKDISTKYEPAKIGDIKESYADITKAKKILGFEPKFSLYEGLKNICQRER